MAYELCTAFYMVSGNSSDGKCGDLKSATMRYSIFDGIAWSVMYQAGTSFIMPLAIALSMPIWVISSISAIPKLMDGLAQKLGTYSSSIGLSRKSLLVYGVAVQALVWVFFAAFVLLSDSLGENPGLWPVLLIILSSVVFFLGGVVNPAWFALMGDVVPDRIRAYWFGSRNRIIIITGMITLLLAGFFMDLMASASWLMVGFTALFAIAAVARAASAYLLNLHHDPNPYDHHKSGKHTEAFRSYSWLITALYLSIFMSASFTPVLMLGKLDIGYFWYAVALVSFGVMQAISAPHWGRLIDKYGTKKVMDSAVALNVIAPIAFIFVSDAAQAVVTNAILGIIWSGVALTTFNYLYEISDKRSRQRNMGDYALMIGVGSFAGSLLGGSIYSFFGGTLFALHALFAFVGVVRAAVALIFGLTTKELGKPKSNSNPHTLSIMAKILTIYPVKGLTMDASYAMSTISMMIGTGRKGNRKPSSHVSPRTQEHF